MLHASVAARTYGETRARVADGGGNQLSRRVNTARGRKGRRGLVWVIGAAVSVGALLYWEQTALLYVLSTLAMSGLLIVVVFADLKGSDVASSESTLTEKAAVAGDAELTTTRAPYRGRGVTKRRHPDATLRTQRAE